MNIWIVNHYAIPPSMGGLVRHYYFSKYLQKKGHTVKIFTSSKIHNTDINMIKDRSLYREEMEDGVEYTFVRSRDYKGNGMDRVINMMDLPFKTWKAMKLFYKKHYEKKYNFLVNWLVYLGIFLKYRLTLLQSRRSH